MPGTDEVAPAIAKRKRSLRRFLKWLAVAAICPVILAVAVSYVLDYYGSRQLAEAQALVRAAGHPATYADPQFVNWQDVYFSEDTGRNAAVYYEAAFSLLRPQIEGRLYELIPIAGRGELPIDAREPLSYETRTAMEDYVFARLRVLDILHDGAGIAGCRYAINWEAARYSLPHHSGGKRAAALLATAICLDAEANRPSEGLQRAKDGFALARSFWNEPTVFGCYFSMSAYRSLLSGIGRLLARTDISNEDLAALQKEVGEAGRGFSVRYSYIGRMAEMAAELQKVLDGHFKEVMPYDDSGDRWSAFQLAKHRLAFWFGRGLVKRRMAAETCRLLRLSEYASDEVGESPGGNTDSRRPPQTALRYRVQKEAYPPDTTLFEGGECRAALRSAETCIAALRFRNDNGAWPENIEVLAPAYLDAVPQDPFTGRPLIYGVTEGGVMAYSVGPNSWDDGGGPSLLARPKGIDERTWERLGDSGFRLWR